MIPQVGDIWKYDDKMYAGYYLIIGLGGNYLHFLDYVALHLETGTQDRFYFRHQAGHVKVS